MSDFYSRIAPWTVTKTGDVTLTSGVRSAAIVPTVPAGMNRWLLGFWAGNRTVSAYTAFELQYGPAFFPLVRLLPWVPSTGLILAKLITDTPNEFYLQNVAGGAQTFDFTVVYADTPPNVLSNLVVGQYAG